MKTTLEKNFQVEEPIDKVWENLTDPEKVVTCVPGATLTEKIDDDNYKGEVTLKFGPVKAKYNGKITFQERDPETRQMQLLGKGTDAKGKGGADMLMNGKLTEVDGKTNVHATMEVTITGMLAQFGSRLINDVSDSVFNQFVANFKNKLAGKEVDNSLNAGSMMGSMVKGMFGKKK